MIKLNYLYIELPKKVRLVSNAMGLNYCFKPDDTSSYWDPHQEVTLCYSKGTSIGDLFKLAKTGLFDHIYAYLNENNSAHYYDQNQNKVDISGWIDIMQFEEGEDH